jgi:N-acetylmuramoyl-L-alanine amidase CwlA
MDDVVNRFARELADSIAAAVAESAEVEACRERARAAGYEMKVNLEAVVGFVNRGQPQGENSETTKVAASKALVPRKPFDMTVNDRRFLRSLRIAAEEAKVEESSQ